RSLALVGENGAGKTTLVKLIARLYDPAAGCITVDGVHLRELDAGAWQRRVSAIFQDFVQFALPARDNVAFGAIEQADNRPALVAAGGRYARMFTLQAQRFVDGDEGPVGDENGATREPVHG